MSALAVTLTVDELRELVRSEVRLALVTKEPDDVLTRRQVAELLKVDVHTVTTYVHRDGLPGHQVQGKWRFRRNSVLQWMDSR